MLLDMEKEEQSAILKGSLLEFIKFFFLHVVGRPYIISNPRGRKSHQIIICEELTKTFRLEAENLNLLINVEPGSGKTLLMQMFIAWAIAQYPDSNFIYTSYSHDLSAKHTSFIKRIMSSSLYKYLFDVKLRYDSKAKDHFVTEQGGTVAAFGSAGSITGRDAGLPGLNRFSGAVIIDDPIKPDAGHSDSIRQNIIKNYEETIRQRPRGINVPIIFIGQRIHEDDLGAYIINNNDVKPWRKIILPSLDESLNALCPERNPKDYLLKLKEKSPYVFASQFQQNPLPAGGALFKPDWFLELDEEPEIIATLITADTAETDKTYNDATAFSFWGVYEVESLGRKTGILGLHWLDTQECFIEPKDLKEAFLNFWQDCRRHSIPPNLAAIEKKSTGVTLLSSLENVQGLQVRDVNRTKASGSKTQRFLEIQPIIASRLVTFTKGAKHVKMCKDHMSKITANNTHKRDDICDTAYDAIKITLIDKTFNVSVKDNAAPTIMRKQKNFIRARSALYGSSS